MRKSLIILFVSLSSFAFGQKVAVELMDVNIVYRGLYNEINWAVEGIERKNVVFNTQNCRIVFENFEGKSGYFLVCDKRGDASITFGKVKKRDTTWFETKNFRVRNLPEESLYLGTLESGTYRKETINNNLLFFGTGEKYSCFRSDCWCEVKRFKLLIADQNLFEVYEINGERIPYKITQLIQHRLSAGASLVFFDVMYSRFHYGKQVLDSLHHKEVVRINIENKRSYFINEHTQPLEMFIELEKSKFSQPANDTLTLKYIGTCDTLVMLRQVFKNARLHRQISFTFTGTQNEIATRIADSDTFSYEYFYPNGTTMLIGKVLLDTSRLEFYPYRNKAQELSDSIQEVAELIQHLNMACGTPVGTWQKYSKDGKLMATFSSEKSQTKLKERNPDNPDDPYDLIEVPVEVFTIGDKIELHLPGQKVYYLFKDGQWVRSSAK